MSVVAEKMPGVLGLAVVAVLSVALILRGGHRSGLSVL